MNFESRECYRLENPSTLPRQQHDLRQLVRSRGIAERRLIGFQQRQLVTGFERRYIDELSRTVLSRRGELPGATEHYKTRYKTPTLRQNFINDVNALRPDRRFHAVRTNKRKHWQWHTMGTLT